MKKLTILIFAALVLFAGCFDTGPNPDKEQAKATKTAMMEANRQVGMPGITNYQQKRLMKTIMELCDSEDLICYAYTKSDYTGKLVYLGKCMGYGIPFSAQYTNPMRRLDGSAAGELTTIPQPDPNGLFMPTSSDATWLMMFDPSTNKPRPVYVESELTISPFRLH